MAVPALRRVLTEMTDERFTALSQFLRHPDWEATNNGAERGGVDSGTTKHRTSLCGA